MVEIRLQSRFRSHSVAHVNDLWFKSRIPDIVIRFDFVVAWLTENQLSSHKVNSQKLNNLQINFRVNLMFS